MGVLHFQLPAGLSAELTRELERACVVGGPDNMPWPSQARIENGQLTVHRDVDESGCLVLPWEISNGGRFMHATATLMERAVPYHVQVELARGKVNQLRCQASDWRNGGLQLTPELADHIQQAGKLFAQAVTHMPSEQGTIQAQEALAIGSRTAEELVRAYVDQVFHARHQRYPRLETALGCRLGPARPEGEVMETVASACNAALLSMGWKEIEPSESRYCWETADQLLDWAEAHHLAVAAGPLIDFAPNRLPGWIQVWEGDLQSIANFMCDYVETVVKRYASRIRSWQLTAASNCGDVLSLGEDEMLWLTVRLAEAARQIDSSLELTIGIAEPWGEYMAREPRSHSPFIFADTLIRAGLHLAGVDLEWVHGVVPEGSYCRDLLDASRLLDLYALLGVPLLVTMGYPSSDAPDPAADAELHVAGGRWRTGFSPATQADWAAAYTALALCKPYVRGVHWVHLSDAQPHRFPHCGLLDAEGNPKPALDKLRELREKHLR